MRKYLCFTAIFVFCYANFAVAQNPYESLGVKTGVLTLSKGKYNEFFDNDTIVQIGSVLFNTNTNKLVGFVEQDTAYSESTMKPEVTSRWLSSDPLADEFPNWSPYKYGNCNPLIFTDPTGMSENPIFDSETGNYLGSDNKGFLEGDVLFMDKGKYDNLSQNNSQLIDHDVATKNSNYTMGSLPDSDKGMALFEKAYNTIAEAGYKVFEGAKPDLKNNKVEAQRFTGTYKDAYAYNDGAIPKGNDGFEKHDIKVNFNDRKDLNTAGNVFSNFLHEYKGHGIMNIGTGYANETRIFNMQVNHPSFKFTSGNYKNHLLQWTK
jgi:hypothetical protein